MCPEDLRLERSFLRAENASIQSLEKLGFSQWICNDAICVSSGLRFFTLINAERRMARKEPNRAFRRPPGGIAKFAGIRALRTCAGVDNENGQPGVVDLLHLLFKNNEKCAVLTFVFAALFVPALC